MCKFMSVRYASQVEAMQAKLAIVHEELAQTKLDLYAAEAKETAAVAEVSQMSCPRPK